VLSTPTSVINIYELDSYASHGRTDQLAAWQLTFGVAVVGRQTLAPAVARMFRLRPY